MLKCPWRSGERQVWVLVLCGFDLFPHDAFDPFLICTQYFPCFEMYTFDFFWCFYPLDWYVRASLFQCEWITRWCCAADMHVSLQTARGQHQLQSCLCYIPSPDLLPWWVHAVFVWLPWGPRITAFLLPLIMFLLYHLYASSTLMH